jgi:uncharacterized membrane protein
MEKTKIALKFTFRKIASYFVQGLVLIAPVFATIYVVYYIFTKLNSITNDIFEFIFRFTFPGLGILSMFLLVTLVGMIGSTLIMQPIANLFEAALEKTPIIKDIYSSVKDFTSAFLSNKKKFNKPVMVEMGNNSGVYKMGFITDEDLSEFGIEDKVAVYFPHSYNFSGNLYIVNKVNIQPLNNVKSSHLMKYIVSAAVMEIDEEPIKPRE